MYFFRFIRLLIWTLIPNGGCKKKIYKQIRMVSMNWLHNSYHLIVYRDTKRLYWNYHNDQLFYRISQLETLIHVTKTTHPCFAHITDDDVFQLPHSSMWNVRIIRWIRCTYERILLFIILFTICSKHLSHSTSDL